MEKKSKGEVTQLLQRMRSGEEVSTNELWKLLYVDLKRLAAKHARNSSQGYTLNPTSLVNELYIKFMDGEVLVDLKDRVHFFALASTAMRQIIVDFARNRQSQKRGGNIVKVQFEEHFHGGEKDPLIDVIVTSDLIERLIKDDPQTGKIAEMKLFGGLSTSEIAEVLQISESTALRKWNAARLWLYNEFSEKKAV